MSVYVVIYRYMHRYILGRYMSYLRNIFVTNEKIVNVQLRRFFINVYCDNALTASCDNPIIY